MNESISALGVEAAALRQIPGFNSSLLLILAYSLIRGIDLALKLPQRDRRILDCGLGVSPKVEAPWG